MNQGNVTKAQVVIQGRVQGVGFRYFVVREARRLGLAGWVRNRPDGAVEVEAEGARDVLERLVAALRRGPVAARVADVSATWSEGAQSFSEFEVTR